MFFFLTSSIVFCTLLLPPSVRLTFFECVAYVFFIVRLRLEELGMNEWWLCVPLNVLDVANHNSRNSALLITSTELTKKSEVTPSTLASAKSDNCFGVRLWFEKGCWRLACAASLLMVSPTLSQASFPFNVAKKFHSAWMWKSFWWNIRFVKFLKFLYCAAEPSLK